MGTTNLIKEIIKRNIKANADKLELENYHKWVKSDEDHFEVVSKTRDLFSEDFDFSISKLISRFSDILNTKLTDIKPNSNKRTHIIVRINRPKSSDYNPPHKDMYEDFDNGVELKNNFVNLWIPIAGVTRKTSLPIAPSSHLISEDKILRTVEGGVIEGNKYRVRMVKEWGGSTTLTRAEVNYGEVLIFSSHLIHGLATNEEDDLTRVALEFRLFKK